MARRLGRWREERGAEVAELPPIKTLQALVEGGEGPRVERLLADHMDGLSADHARLAVQIALGEGGRAGGHRAALLLGHHPAVAAVVDREALRGLVAPEHWVETAAGLRLGLDLEAVRTPSHASALAALLHGLPRSPGELDRLRERAERLGGPRHHHALVDGLAATELWDEACTTAAAFAREARRAEHRVGLLDRAAVLARRAGDPVQAGAHAARALLLMPSPGRALALLGRPEDGSLAAALDELYEELELVAAECQVLLELATGELGLALDRAEASDPAALGSPGHALRWVLAATLCWSAPGRAPVPGGVLDGLLATHCRVGALLGRAAAPEGPVLPGGVGGALLAHQKQRAGLRLEAEWCHSAAFGLVVRLVDAAARDRDRYPAAARWAAAWLERAVEDDEGARRAVRELSLRHPRHRALRDALAATVNDAPRPDH